MNEYRPANAVAETHEILYRQSLEHLEVAYLKSRQQGQDDVVFTLIDFSDPLGEKIANEIGVLERAQSHIREAVKRGHRSLGTSWDTRPNVQGLFSELPEVVELLNKQPTFGNFHTLIVAEGAVSLRETPLPV